MEMSVFRVHDRCGFFKPTILGSINQIVFKKMRLNPPSILISRISIKVNRDIHPTMKTKQKNKTTTEKTKNMKNVFVTLNNPRVEPR